MARKTTAQKADQPSADVPVVSAGNWLTHALFRPRVLLPLALAVLSSMLVPLGKRHLPDLSEREEYRLRTLDIEITEPPRWVPPDIVRQVVSRAGLPENVSLLNEEVAREIADSFRLHPWVAEVISVRKSIRPSRLAGPARLEVELSYRQPVAMVEVKLGMYPVDALGTLLPPADFSVADTKRYPVIRNVSSTPQGPAGTHWGDECVVAAARLAAILGPHWKRFDLEAIRAPRREQAKVEPDDLVFELATQGGSTILWGRAPGTDHPGELSPEQKIGRLEKYLADFGSFDQPHGPYEIDIRHWQEISRRPLAAQTVPSRR